MKFLMEHIQQIDCEKSSFQFGEKFVQIAIVGTLALPDFPRNEITWKFFHRVSFDN